MEEKMWLMFTVSFCLIVLFLFPLLSSFLQAPGVLFISVLLGEMCVGRRDKEERVCLSSVLCMALMRMKWD